MTDGEHPPHREIKVISILQNTYLAQLHPSPLSHSCPMCMEMVSDPSNYDAQDHCRPLWLPFIMKAWTSEWEDFIQKANKKTRQNLTFFGEHPPHQEIKVISILQNTYLDQLHTSLLSHSYPMCMEIVSDPSDQTYLRHPLHAKINKYSTSDQYRTDHESWAGNLGE